MELLLIYNSNANVELVNKYLRETYPGNFQGYKNIDGVSPIVMFATELSEEDQEAVEDWYASLGPSDNANGYRLQIYQYMSFNGAHDEFEPPIEIDYIRSLDQRLHPVITDVYKGEVREITYYESVTIDPTTGVQTGVTPIVKEVYTYTRNADKIAQYRVMTISWFRRDGVIHSVIKNRHKYYTNEQAIVEGVTRRGNIIDFMQIPMLGMMMQTIPCSYSDAVDQGGLFFEQYVVEVETYKFSPRQGTLQTAITNDTTYTWLDNVIAAGPVTIRDYMLDQLNY